MVSIAIIEVFVVIFLVVRVLQTCCTSPATTALPTIIALNPIPATQTTAAPVVIAPSLTATPIPDTATLIFSPTPSSTLTTTASPIPPSPTSTPTASATAVPITPTSTTVPTIAATTLPSSTPPGVVAQSTTIVLPTVAIPTALTPSRIPTTIEPPTPTLTPTTTATSNDPTATSTVTATATRSPTPHASGQCSWAWATRPLPEITEVAQIAINNAGLTNVTLRSEAYGETCIDTTTHEPLGFSAMTTDFYLIVPVTNLNDSISLAQIIKTATNTLSSLNVPLPAALGVLRITFTSGSDQKVFGAQIMNINSLITSGASAADILAAGGIN